MYEEYLERLGRIRRDKTGVKAVVDLLRDAVNNAVPVTIFTSSRETYDEAVSFIGGLGYSEQQVTVLPERPDYQHPHMFWMSCADFVE
jgi:hypothetical protein